MTIRGTCTTCEGTGDHNACGGDGCDACDGTGTCSSCGGRGTT